MSTVATTAAKPAAERFFYLLAALLLLGVTFIGFELFYTHGQAFPGRPLTPPIRGWLILHGVLMSAWMLFSVVQPLLVATGRKRIHMMLGRIGAVLAVALIVVGLEVAIHAARVNPPDLRLFGLVSKQFLIVPVSGMPGFDILVSLGIWQRRRAEIHRPLMLMSSLAVVSAALGRMPRLNDWYGGTWLEYVTSAFFTTILLGGLLVAAKWVMTKKFDRWLFRAWVGLALLLIGASLSARTAAWEQIATWLIQG